MTPEEAYEVIQDAFPESRIGHVQVPVNMFKALQEYHFIVDGKDEVHVLDDGRMIMSEETAKRLTR